MRYVVTGAAGFIGSHLARALLDSGHEVLGVDCFTDYYDLRIKEENAAGLDVVRADLAEAPLDDLLAGADGIYHFAGQPGVRSFGDVFPVYLRRNVLATQRVLDAAARAGVRVVLASSSSIYGDAETYPTREEAVPRPLSPYGITKLACEQLVRAYALGFDLDAVVLRFFTVYGPRQRPDMAFTRLLTALAAGAPFELYGDGRQSRGFTYVSDAVTATIAAMESAPSGAVYNVGGGSETTMLAAIALGERVAGRKLEVRHVPAAAGDARRTSADTARIRRDLGWEPEVALEDGLRAHWQWAVGRVENR